MIENITYHRESSELALKNGSYYVGISKTGTDQRGCRENRAGKPHTNWVVNKQPRLLTTSAFPLRYTRIC